MSHSRVQQSVSTLRWECCTDCWTWLFLSKIFQRPSPVQWVCWTWPFFIKKLSKAKSMCWTWPFFIKYISKPITLNVPHWEFPGGPPSKYYLSPTMLNFSDLTRTGGSIVVWWYSLKTDSKSIYHSVIYALRVSWTLSVLCSIMCCDLLGYLFLTPDKGIQLREGLSIFSVRVIGFQN